MKNTGEWTQEEFAIYEEGKKMAARTILEKTRKHLSTPTLIRETETLLLFLRRNPHIAIDEVDTEVWNKHLRFSSTELISIAEFIVSDYRMRLEKARVLHAAMQTQLANFQNPGLSL